MQYQFSSLEEFKNVIQSNKNNIFLAGAGCYGKIMGAYFNHAKIPWNGYLDNDQKKQGQRLNDKEIYPYEEIRQDTKVAVVICTIMRSKEIEDQILDLGIEEERIIRFDNRMIFDLADYEVWEPQKEIDRIKALKGIGREKKRCFILATGPSLTISDLEALDGEFTISVNSIVRCFSKTDWRPDCYVAMDPTEYDTDIKEYGLQRLAEECGYLVFAVKTGMLSKAEKIKNAYFFHSLDEPYEKLPKFSGDLTQVVYESSTVIYSALQIAMYMGFREIYMVGADLGFSQVRNIHGKVELRNKEEATADFLKETAVNTPIYEEDRIIRGYLAAREYAERHGIILKNATRGGYLEVLERVSLDELLQEK